MPETKHILALQVPELTVPPVNTAEIERYAMASGDRNPVHTDAALARKAGLPGIPIHGMMVMGFVSGYLEDWEHCAKIERLQVRFVFPALVDIGMTIRARPVSVGRDNALVVLRISVNQQGRIICMGEADVLISGDTSCS